MKRIYLALAIHNHQPVGNFDFVFEEAYQRSYAPFLSILAKHPKIKMAFHLPGFLFERFGGRHFAQLIHKAGMRYTILDDAHFKYAGLEERELYGYFVTEEMGDTVNLFPICEK